MSLYPFLDQLLSRWNWMFWTNRETKSGFVHRFSSLFLLLTWSPHWKGMICKPGTDFNIECPLLKVDFIQKVRFIFQISKSSIKNIPNYKADLLQLKLTPIICLMNFIKKKVGMWKLFLELMHEISFSTYLSCIENVSLNMPSVCTHSFNEGLN